MDIAQLSDLNKRIAMNNRKHDSAVERKKVAKEALEKKIFTFNETYHTDLSADDPNIKDVLTAMYRDESNRLSVVQDKAEQFLKYAEAGNIAEARAVLDPVQSEPEPEIPFPTSTKTSAPPEEETTRLTDDLDSILMGSSFEVKPEVKDIGFDFGDLDLS